MATLARQIIDQDGLVPSMTAAAASQKAKPGPGVFLLVKNGDSGSHDIVINDPTSRDPGASTTFNPDVTVAVAAGAEKLIAFGDRFADPADDGLGAWSWSATTSMTIAVVKA